MNFKMKFKTLCQFGKQFACYAHVAVLAVTVAFSPVAFAIQIKLGAAMRVRTLSSDQLTVAGVLPVGSIVEIPDLYKVKNENGAIDADRTFNNWLNQAGYDRSEVTNKIRNPLKDFFYPIRIVSIKGSPTSNLTGKTRFMALRVLARSRGGLTVKENAPFYKASNGALPLHAATQARRTRPALESRPSEPRTFETSPNPEAEKGQSVADQTLDKESTEAAIEQNPNAEKSTDSGEAQSGAFEDCPACRTSNNSAADTADEISSTLNRQVYNDEAQGLQRLTRQFPSACKDFIDSDGSYGPLGQTVLNAMSHSDAFKSDWAPTKKATQACPNFNSFGPEQRRHFWVYVFAAMEAEESGCNQSANADSAINDNGVAAGGAQIEERSYLRQMRDRSYGGHFCAGSNPYNSDLNIKCSVRTLQDTVENGEGPYSVKQNIYGPYWSSFKFDKMKAKALISQYTACGATPYYTWKKPPMPRGYWKHHKRTRQSSHSRHNSGSRS